MLFALIALTSLEQRATADEVSAPVSTSIDTLLGEASAALALARKHGNVWLETPSKLAAAKSARHNGDEVTARKLAETSLKEAQLALNQALLERARYRLERAGGSLERDIVGVVQGFLDAHDGNAAWQALHAALQTRKRDER